MKAILEGIILYFILFIVIYGLYYIFAILSKRRLKKFKNNTYVKYLVNVYKLDQERINEKHLATTIVLLNSFVMSTTIFIILFIKNVYLMFICGFIILFVLQLLTYHIAGKIFQKRFGRDK